MRSKINKSKAEFFCATTDDGIRIYCAIFHETKIKIIRTPRRLTKYTNYGENFPEKLSSTRCTRRENNFRHERRATTAQAFYKFRYVRTIFDDDLQPSQPTQSSCIGRKIGSIYPYAPRYAMIFYNRSPQRLHTRLYLLRPSGERGIERVKTLRPLPPSPRDYCSPT